MAEFLMPSLGADMDEGTLLEWLVKPGDQVNKGDIVAVVDTAKAAVEVECFDSGVITGLLVEPGQCVPVGAPLAVITPAGQAAAPALATPPVPATPAKPAPAKPAAAKPAPSKPAPAKPAAAKPAAARRVPARTVSPILRHLAERSGVDLSQLHGTGAGGSVTRADVERAAAQKSRIKASPFARRVAAELGIDLKVVEGTGAGGAIKADDVRIAASTRPLPKAARAAPDGQPVAAATRPQAAGPQPEPGSRAALPEAAVRQQAAMRQAIANLMARSKREIPHYYLTSTIDLEQAAGWLRRRNRELPVTARIVPSALLLKAAAVAAREVPELNGFWIDDHFQPSAHVHLGVAISFRGGGMVAPAIHDADTLELGELMARLRGLVTRARQGRLRGSEMTDPTITVTNLGDRGVESVLGVIYPPQVALVGFGKVMSMPCAVDGLLGVRSVVTATLAADHRATDGYTGARYLEAVARLLQKPEEL